MKSFEAKARKVQKIDAALARWWRRLKRATNEIDRLQAQRRRLTAPRKLAPEETATDDAPFNDEIGL